MVLVKNLKFFERFVLCKIHPEKVFGDVLVSKQAFIDNINVLDKKEAFKDYKNNCLRKTQNKNFSKRVSKSF